MAHRQFGLLYLSEIRSFQDRQVELVSTRSFTHVFDMVSLNFGILFKKNCRHVIFIIETGDLQYFDVFVEP